MPFSSEKAYALIDGEMDSESSYHVDDYENKTACSDGNIRVGAKYHVYNYAEYRKYNVYL